MIGAAPLKRFVACEEKRASRLFRVALEHDAGRGNPVKGSDPFTAQSILMRRRNC